MIKRVILISGHISSGKSTLANNLAKRYDMSLFKTNEVLRKKILENQPPRRGKLQEIGDDLDASTRGKWVATELEEWVRQKPEVISVIVDAVRTKEQSEALRKVFGPVVTHIHLIAPTNKLQERFSERFKKKPILENTDKYDETQLNETEKHVDELKGIADIVIDTGLSTISDVFVRAACHLHLNHGIAPGYVDVLIGGQYGSEGKGQIAAYLGREYALLIRVGGPNAGHKVFEEPKPYPHHQLPSGTRKCEARLLIGPGAVLNIEKLMTEIAECNVDSNRLCIDGNAMVINNEDVLAEKDLKKDIGSTGQGVGAATARRILNRGKNSTILARDIPDIKPFIGSAYEVLADAISRGKRVFLEGTQGTALSLYHGFYPYVTSRDTTVSGCLAEAGVSPNTVRKIIMVCRTYPIRVASPKLSTSGWMSQETTWREIARRSGLDYKEILKTEKTTTTNRGRRVAEFDWALLQMAAFLNNPTDIALTFTDYLSKTNQKAQRFEQLHPDTINFIQEVECVAGAPVSLISTGFNPRSIIDRRSW
ncbi:adenylosuccinate synthetase [Chloroflexota bacterium]